MPLSDVAIRNARPQDRPYKMYDAGGLFLLVTPSGHKWWRFKYRFAGKEKLLSLGVYPAVGLKDARRRRDDAQKLLALAIDSSAQRKAAKAEALAIKTAKQHTFEVIAREWYRKKKGVWTPGYQKTILSWLENQLFPYLEKAQLAELEAADFLVVIRKAEARGERLRQRTDLRNSAGR